MSSSEEKNTSPPAKRRRSSITRRKSVIPIPIEYTHELALREYISDAKREKEEWGDFYRHRKSQLKISEAALAQVSADPPTYTSDFFHQDLTEEDLKNLQQPDYGNLCEDIDRLVEKAALVKIRLDGVSSVLKSNILCSKARLNAISRSICTFNDTAPLWLQNPSKYKV